MRRRPFDANREPTPKLDATGAIALSRFIGLTTGVFDEPSVLHTARCARYLSAEAGMEVLFHVFLVDLSDTRAIYLIFFLHCWSCGDLYFSGDIPGRR